MNDQIKTEQPNEAHISPSELNTGLAAKTQKTDLGKHLIAFRNKYLENGGKLFTADEINAEVHKNRGS